MLFYTLFIVLLSISASISLYLFIFLLRFRDVTGAIPFMIMLSGTFIWSAGYICELVVPSLAAKIFWDNVQFLGADLLAAGTFGFAITYTNARRSLRHAWWLAIFPIVNMVMVWSDPWHGLVRVAPLLDAGGAILVLAYGFGTWFWLCFVYGYLLFISAVGLLLFHLVRSHPRFRLQILAIALGLSAPLIGVFLTLFALVPIPNMDRLDVTPITFIFTTPLLAWGVLRQRLFDLVPVAREQLVDQLPDGVVVLDARQRIVDVNPAATALLRCSTGSLIGAPVSSALPVIAPLFATAHAMPSTLITLPPHDDDPLPVSLDVTISPLYNRRRRLTGWLALLRNISPQQRDRAALRESQALLEGLLNHSPAGIAVMDTLGRYLVANRRLVAMLRRSDAHEVLGKTCADLLPPALAAVAAAEIQQVLHTRAPRTSEAVYPSEDGIHTIIAERFPLFDETGQIFAIGVISTDISERKQMEETLRATRTRLAFLIESAPAVIFSISISDAKNDKTYKTTFVSPNVTALTGYQPADFTSDWRFWGNQIHPDDVPGIIVRRTNILEEGHSSGQYRFRCRDGVYRWLQDEMRLVKGGNGQSELIGYWVDITERRQAEEALREQETLFRLTFDQSPVGAAIVGLDYRYLRVNDTLCQITGYTAEELLALDFPTITHPDDLPADLEHAQELAAGRINQYTLDKRYLHKGGQIVWVQLTVRIVRRDNGAPMHFLALIKDITEIRRANAELVRAKEAAEASSRAKSQFVANISHELRTPLNAIIGMTDLLIDSQLTEAQRDYAATIRNSGEMLLTLINDLLDFSKIEAGKLEIERQPFPLMRCIEEALDLVALPAARKRLALAYELDAGVPETIIGDEARLRQILVNLLSNAVKFTERGEVVVSVSSAPQHERIHRLSIAVRDTGIGIPTNRYDRLFHAFSQIDAATTRRYGGTGLGLAICKRVADLMHGTIEVESEPGVGSTFRLVMLVEAESAQPPELLDCSHPAFTGQRLLLIDANPTSRAILSRQLERWGLHPTPAASLPEVLELLPAAPFKGVIIAPHLSDMDRIAIARTLHTATEAQPVPLILLLDGFQSLADQDRALFAAIVNWPVRPTQLHAALCAVLTGTSNRPEPLARQQHAVNTALRILLAEDNPVNQHVARQMLSRLGYALDIVANGAEAIAAVMRQTYDIVLMDVQMPEVDGITASRLIRAMGDVIVQPRIIALTAQAHADDREQCQAAGMDDFVSKPVHLHDLQRALEAAAGKVAGAPAQPTPAPPDMTEQQLLDHAAINYLQTSLGEIGVEVVRDAIHLFFQETPLLLDEMAASAARGDRQKIEWLAHKLRGGSRQIGADALAAYCLKLEQMPNDATPVTFAELVAATRAVFAQTADALRAYV